jgi:putative lipoprotein
MTRSALIALAFLTAAETRAEPFWGPDKQLHFLGSIALSGAGYALAATWNPSMRDRALIGAGISLAIGAGKEGLDAVTGGTPSWNDFAWDMIGTACGIGTALLVDKLVRGNSAMAATSPPTPSGLRPAQFVVNFGF